jgi:MYXO-CTERM domain-containing protein
VDAGVVNTPPADRVTDAGCQPTGVKYCRALPKTCTDNTQCPTDWTCQSTGDNACFASAYADGAAAPCTTQPSTSLCAPPGRGFGTVGGNGSADTGRTPPTASPTSGAAGAAAQGAPGATSAAAPTVDASGGGCNVASTSSNGTAGLLMALGALFALGRRRRI